MTEIMGILNITPDSFSDGGAYVDPAAALQHARAMREAGATIIDVGGESTRPGATRITPAEEQRRILDTVAQLAAEGFTVSVDTLNAATAQLTLEAGAQLINDVSGGLSDPDMYATVAAAGARYSIGHWRGIPAVDASRSDYADVTGQVASELTTLAQRAIAAGVRPERIILDPGLGFDKTEAQNWQLLRELKRLTTLGYPVLVGASRKRMIAGVLERVTGSGGSGAERDTASAVAAALAAREGAWGVRVHSVELTAQALAVADAFTGETAGTHAAAAQPTAAPATAAALPPAGCTRADRITLTGLAVTAHHGVYEFERVNGQPFIIDAELSLTRPASTDRLESTVNYATVLELLERETTRDPVDLIETLAERLALAVLALDGVQEVSITVHKPEAPVPQRVRDISVTVTRAREAA